jgi:hypothetical protein
MFTRPLLASVLLAFSAFNAFAELAYEFTPGFIQPPAGKETIGDGHGEIAVDSAGKIYVSVEKQKEGGLQVYGPDGKFIKSLAGAPGSLHGFVIHKGADGEFIYGSVLSAQKVVKMDLEGKVVMEIPTSAFPADKAGKGLKLTSTAVAPNGDIYVVDGYGADWIFQFDKAGNFKAVFGGREGDLKLKNCHKIFVDPRFEPARLFLCDRANERILHTDLDGKLIGVIKDKDLRRPSSASFHGEHVCIAGIAGVVTVLDKAGNTVAVLGKNEKAEQTNTPNVPPADWKADVVTSPHGITFDNEGNILETEWNKYGRVLRWTLKKGK